MTFHRLFAGAAVFLFVAASLGARGSDAIPARGEGISAPVKQPHVTAELIAETTHPAAGKPFDVILHLHMDPDWHTYWINPGDAGLATTIKWTLPAGFTAGPIQWPVPEVHMMGPETTYGYGGDVYLLTTITPPASVTPGPVEIKARADWLVCQEECIPGKAELGLTLQMSETAGQGNANRALLFAAARARLPVANTQWSVKGTYGPDAVNLVFTALPGAPMQDGVVMGVTFPRFHFFPEQGNVLAADERTSRPDWDGLQRNLTWSLGLQQNGEKPDHLSGVFVSDRALIGPAKAVYIASFPVSEGTAVTPTTSAAPAAAAPGDNSSDGHSPPLQEEKAPLPSAAAQPFLIAVLGAAFLGGIILNLMPCVLPVLSLKVFSLVRHAGHDPRGAWKQGVAFTAGVVISFWVLAGLLIALRAAGSHIGWGFQMQSPGFIAALILLFFLLGLNLFGVFELGASLVGLDAKATGNASGLPSSFLNGALATLAATPCTAPFMGGALGFAAEQPPFVDLLIFTFLALGMASPYLLLTIFPGALRFVPKPGAWMEAVKQFMGFLLLATVIFLVYVFGALVGQDQVPWLLGVLLLAGVAAWIYGRWGGPGHAGGVRFAAVVLALVILGGAVRWVVMLARTAPPSVATVAAQGDWQAWSPAAVEQALSQGRPVFVDFTAAWCLSCKVNEKVALESDEVRAAFAQKKVALFRADWTHQDPAISETLDKYHRDGVPLYLLYSPKAKDEPQVLPEVLTPGMVVEALGKV
jgi:thiol:disulfide interchange protein/DsbC/DsbD-like thiol-disulfide interchange protein